MAPDRPAGTGAGSPAGDAAAGVPGGSRSVEVPLRRLGAWLDGFERRHGAPLIARASQGWSVEAPDGARALIHPPAWLELLPPRGRVPMLQGLEDPRPPQPARGGPEPARGGPGLGAPAADLAGLGALRPSFGVLLVRRAGYAVAHVVGHRIVSSKVGSRHIHGRTAAGGWSQQRYARRRGHQADEVADAAAGAAGRILAGVELDFLVTGGDRPLLGAARSRLVPALATLPVGAHLAVGTPDRVVLGSVPDRVLAVHVEVEG